MAGKKKTRICPDISDMQWYDHFKSLFNVPQVNAINFTPENLESDCDDINSPIGEREVYEAVHKLKNGKASGIDEISAEMLKLSGNQSVKFMTTLFNSLFEKGQYPEEWTKAIIVPIFKKGNKTSPDNYRGISLSSLMSKCYTTILNRRLVKWIENNRKLTESQAGFRKGYSTFDHIFTLNAIVEKCFSKKGGKLYACFVDLRKAFDSVQHDSLFEIMLKIGIHGKFMKAVMAIYNEVQACVRIDDRFIDFFDCPVGVRQGCILSPELFSIFINEIATTVDEKGIHGIQLLPGLVEIFILLFADDIVLLSDTARGLQNQIDILNTACKKLSLNVNKDKTKIMVFRKGGFLGKNDNWTMDGDILEVVNEYNYLGFVFTTKMSIQKCVDALAVKGKRACIECVKNISKLHDISRSCYFKIFDSQVQPVLLYASEVWGLKRLDNIEKVHSFACKRFLKVPLKLPNKFVLGEMGRHPLYVNTYVRCIKYWLRLLKMDISRLPKTAYRMLLTLDDKGKPCWASQVKNTLFRLGFGYAWINQGVGREIAFLSLFKQRLKDNYQQEWDESIMNKDMYSQYRLFKTSWETEPYFEFLDLRCFRDGLIKLRLGVLPIKGSSFRTMFSTDPNMNFLCKSCKVIENENHFVHVCPLYEEIRTKYLSGIEQQYTDILRDGQVRDVRKLTMYVFYALRKKILVDE